MSHMRNLHADALEVSHLRLLEAIGRTGSLSRAAEEMGLSQPTASHALARMRQLLNDELFVRTARGMVPTAFGEQMCDVSAKALRILQEGLKARTDFDPATASRTFRLYLSDVGQLVLLPPLLAVLRRRAPAIVLHVEHLPRTDQERAFELGEMDLAIGHIQSLAAGFRQRTLFLERYVCVASADNPRFENGMSLEAFMASPHAFADSSGMAHWVVDDALSAQGISRKTGLVVPEFMTLPFVIAGSELLLTVPGRLADRFCQLSPLKVMPPPVTLAPYPIRMFWHQRAHRDPANQWLRQLFAELFATADSVPGEINA